MKKVLITAAVMALSLGAAAQVKVNVHESAKDQPVIPKEIYGQFAEHLGRCIYDGLWVGEDSDIPNINGYRKDIVEALKELKVPVLRWPGGCFADEYHWMDGIGPKDKRAKIVNSNWGGTIEDNSFGTHEFLNLCELIGTEPYISGNVGSGSVEELAKWVEYMTAENGSMAELRKSNGREKPWKVKYLGVGNESWGCGGNMDPDYYSDLYKRYAIYCREYDGNRLYKIASGANGGDYNWTKVLMDDIRQDMSGLSFHFYSVIEWNNKLNATNFPEDEYYNTIAKACEVEQLIRTHSSVMDIYDPHKRVGLLLDEWGTWYNVEPGTNPGHLFQQNTMRDAIVAGLSLNIFHDYVDRLKMANIAQIVNVLQSMILTKGKDMVLTPTYHVFRMYNVHQDATYLPTDCSSAVCTAPSGQNYPDLSVTASKSDAVHISLVNSSLSEDKEIEISFDSLKPKSVSAEILRGAGKDGLQSVNAYNDFGKNARNVEPVALKDVKIDGGKIRLTVPTASVIVLSVK